MPRAIAREKRKETISTEDVMAVRLMQWASWASRNSRAVIAGAVVVIAIGAGVWYFIDYQRSVTQQAAVELETLRATATIGSREEAVASLNTFVQRFGGTVYADEARLMLGRLSLDQQDWPAAIEVLEPAAAADLDTPIGFGAAMLLAYAYEGQGDPARAAQILGGAATGARYGYQRHQALEEQARVLVDAGDYDGAVAAYGAILAEVEVGELADRVRARMAEARALETAAAAAPRTETRTLPASGSPAAATEPQESSGG